MGVSLKPGGADPAVQALAARASTGDKQAQYELGRWFEDSTDANGMKKAIKLYQIAATPRGGSRMMYTPGPSGVTTSVVSMRPKIEGNELAQKRLRQVTLSPEIENEFSNIGHSKKITNRVVKSGWFKIRKIYSCEQFEHNPSECTYFVQGDLSSKIKIENIFELNKLIIDISGNFLCTSVCIYENRKFLVSNELRSVDPSFMYINDKNKLVGVVVQSSLSTKKLSNILYLSSYGSKLSNPEIRKILYRYGMFFDKEL
jgi:hypothetical protein